MEESFWDEIENQSFHDEMKNQRKATSVKKSLKCWFNLILFVFKGYRCASSCKLPKLQDIMKVKNSNNNVYKK